MSLETTPEQPQSWTETPPLSPFVRHAVGEIVESQAWLDKLSNPLQSWLLSFFGSPGQPMRSFKDVLNGTWLGHPVHPMLTDIPLGAWSVTTLLDIASFDSGRRGNGHNGVARSADLSLTLGLLGAVGAAATGITDWSDLDGTDRRVGLLHGLLNGSVTLLYLASLGSRLSGRRRLGVGLSTIGYLTSLFSAYLGGELSFAKGIGVNHNAWEPGSDDFIAVMSAQDLEDGKLTRVEVAGIPAVLLKQGDSLYAISAVCSHLAGPLDEGTVQDGIVTCPWHGSCFRMIDGSVVTGPAVYAQPTFAVRVRNGMIELRRLEHA